MSYAKIKTIILNEKENKIIITSAENNIRPLMWSKWELQSNTNKKYEEKLYTLFENLMWGDFRLENSVSKKILNATSKALKFVNTYDLHWYEIPDEDKKTLFDTWKYFLNEKLDSSKYIITFYNRYLKKINIRTYETTYDISKAKKYTAYELENILQRVESGITKDYQVIKISEV